VTGSDSRRFPSPWIVEDLNEGCASSCRRIAQPSALLQSGRRVHDARPLLIVFVALATGFEPQFNGPVAITAVVLLFLGAIADGA
jgi:hypothetical protein